MPDCASNLTQLLESDLESSGFEPGLVGPRLPDAERYQATLASLRRSLLKKYTYEDESGDETRNAKALELFLACNSRCASWGGMAPEDDEMVVAVGEAKATLDSFGHDEAGRGILLTFNRIREGLDVGKGANIGCTNVDFYSKVFCSPATSSSSDLVDLYRLAIADDPNWSLGEQIREATMGYSVVAGSKLTFVPKTATISRTICTEPLINMLFQKGIERVLLRRLRQFFGIDLSSQPDKNRALARVGSRTGRFATIDLSSASDLNSTKMINEFFPPSIHRWLERTRSPSTVLPNGQVVELHMMSSMGNAFTFPLQTILFASVVHACYRVLGIKIENPRGTSLGNYGVFGDDIIVVTEAYGLVCRMLNHLGHTVNVDKSFNSGPFRESCGSDWFAGHDIRGVYIKRLDDVCDYYSTINRLNVWCAKHRVLLPRVVQWLLSQCRRRFFVPMHESEVAGIRVPTAYGAGTANRRQFGLNYKCLTVASYKVILTDEESFISRVRKSKGNRANAVEKYLARAWYNPYGQLTTALSGKLRDGSFSIREYRRRTVVKRRSSSCWDWVGAELSERGLGDDLIVVTLANLGEVCLKPVE